MNLKDIGKIAGVSAVTVSNVINGKHDKVSRETIEKVQKIIEEYNFKPNATARCLASRKSKIIGVVVPLVSEDDVFSSNPCNNQMIAHLERYIRKQGYQLMLRSVDRCQEVIPTFLAWNVEGIIFFGTRISEVEELQRRLEIPVVFLEAYEGNLPIASVRIDDYKGGYLATRYLLGKGHHKIAFVGPDITKGKVISERYLGFCNALDEKGIAHDLEDVFATWTVYEGGVKIGKQIAFAKEKYTAVVVTSDIVALGVMEGLRLSGLSVPEDVSVVGFDNLPEGRYSYPQLTTVSQNLEGKAFTAGEYLFSMINSGERQTGSKVIDVEIVERQSVALKKIAQD